MSVIVGTSGAFTLRNPLSSDTLPTFTPGPREPLDL